MIMRTYKVTLRYESLVEIEVSGTTEYEAIENAYEAAEDNFLGKWTIESVKEETNVE